MSEPLFKLQLYQKRDSATGVFLWILKQFKNTLFTEHLWISASILQQLLALYFAIIYSWQLSSGEKSLVEKKFIHIFQGFYRFRFLSHRYICFFFFSFFFDKSLFTLSVTKAYAVLWAANRFVGSETPKHNTFDQLWTFKFHFEHFPRKWRTH